MRTIEMVTLPNGQTVTVLNFVPVCENCEIAVDVNIKLCSPCTFLAQDSKFQTRMWGENQGLVNRRWQMRFNRGSLEDRTAPFFKNQCWPTTPLWETKRKEQTW